MSFWLTSAAKIKTVSKQVSWTLPSLPLVRQTDSPTQISCHRLNQCCGVWASQDAQTNISMIWKCHKYTAFTNVQSVYLWQLLLKTLKKNEKKKQTKNKHVLSCLHYCLLLKIGRVVYVIGLRGLFLSRPSWPGTGIEPTAPPLTWTSSQLNYIPTNPSLIVEYSHIQHMKTIKHTRCISQTVLMWNIPHPSVLQFWGKHKKGLEHLSHYLSFTCPLFLWLQLTYLALV